MNSLKGQELLADVCREGPAQAFRGKQQGQGLALFSAGGCGRYLSPANTWLGTTAPGKELLEVQRTLRDGGGVLFTHKSASLWRPPPCLPRGHRAPTPDGDPHSSLTH